MIHHSITRRGFMSLVTVKATVKHLPSAPARTEDWTVFSIDDEHNKLIATVKVWLVKGYTIKDMVRQLAEDYGVCRGKA